MEVPARTKIKRSFFKAREPSRHSLIINDLSSSGDGTLSLKLDNRVSDGCWFGRRLTLARLHIKEYKANVPPANYKYLRLLFLSPANFGLGYSNSLLLYLLWLNIFSMFPDDCHLNSSFWGIKTKIGIIYTFTIIVGQEHNKNIFKWWDQN